MEEQVFLDITKYINQMIESNANYNKKPIKKILRKIQSYEMVLIKK